MQNSFCTILFCLLNVLADELIETIYAQNQLDRFLLSGNQDEYMCAAFNALFVRISPNPTPTLECECASGETLLSLNGEAPKFQIEDSPSETFGEKIVVLFLL